MIEGNAIPSCCLHPWEVVKVTGCNFSESYYRALPFPLLPLMEEAKRKLFDCLVLVGIGVVNPRFTL